MSNTKKSRTTVKQGSTKKSSASGKKTASKGTSAAKQAPAAKSRSTAVVVVSLIIALVLELSNLNLLGQVGGYIQYAQFGLFGIMAYVFPIAGFLFVLYFKFSQNKKTKNIVCFVILFVCLCALTHLISGLPVANGSLSTAWDKSAADFTGGGIIGGIIAVGLGIAVSRVGAYIIVILAIVVCVIQISEYPLADKVGEFIRRRRENRYYAEADYDEYEEYEEYEEEPYEEEYKEPVRKKTRRENLHLVEEAPRKVSAKPVASRTGNLRAAYDAARDKSLPENNRRAKVYEGMDEDGNYIKIVHVPSKKKTKPQERADLNRTNKKSQTVRSSSSPAKLSRSQNVQKGLGEGLEFYALDANGDEIHEITDHTVKLRKYAVEEAENNAVSTPDKAPEINPAEEAAAASAGFIKTTEEEQFEKKTVSAGTSAFAKPPKKENREPKTDSGVVSASKATTAAKPVSIPNRKPGKDNYQYPPLDLLEQRKAKTTGKNDDLEKVSRNLELILSTYGVNAKVVDAQAGPSVTRYELQPELGTRVSRITSLADDLKLNLAVPDIRIEAPIPGRAAIGIEIPNKTKETVFMRELLEEPTLISHPSKIAYAAGKDISGNVVVSDIAQMPHLLVAGTTGSGKSIFVNTILMTILFRAKPSEVGLIIIDPKKVEFGVYSGIPHLVQDVVTDPGQAVSTLRWAVVEMTNRYQRMQLSGVRDFKSYNAKFDKGQLNPEEENPKRMPQIVIVIDELADLMMVASKETESLICRLAQLARAAGIHLIIATQRPSVDVVTGLIKANIPARVALLVASGTDSRTIIDSNGAEKLLGKGDMLFYPTGYVKPVRVQGAFVSEKEVYDTIQYIKENNESGYYAEEAEELETYKNSSGGGNTGIPGLTGGDDSGSDNKYDEYFYEAGKLCIETGKASSSMIQRRFSIGFNRAARIIDQLQEAGAVGPQNGAKPREILVDEMQFEEIWQSLQ